MNSITIIGRLTRDPKQIGTEQEGCELRIAFDQPGGAGFITIESWGATANACLAYLHAGDEVGVTGALRFLEWDDPNGRRSCHTVKATRINFLRRVKTAPLEGVARLDEEITEIQTDDQP